MNRAMPKILQRGPTRTKVDDCSPDASLVVAITVVSVGSAVVVRLGRPGNVRSQSVDARMRQRLTRQITGIATVQSIPILSINSSFSPRDIGTPAFQHHS